MSFADTVAALARITHCGITPGQTFQHHETEGVYVVIAIGLNEADLEPLVHYRDADDEDATVWTRHLDAFCGQAVSKSTGLLVKRFTPVS